MKEIVKHINDTNASYRKIGAGNAKNTDLFLDNEHYGLFSDAGDTITVRLNKQNLTQAILFIASILPRKYDNSSVHQNIDFSTEFIYEQLAILDAFFTIDGNAVETRTQTWNPRKDVLKKNGEIDNRFYFNGLLEDIFYTNINGEKVSAKFTIRNYLAGGFSDLHFRKKDNGIFDVWVTNTTEYSNTSSNDTEEIKPILTNKLIASNKVLKSFILDVIKYFDNNQTLKAITPYLYSKDESTPYKIEKDGEFRLTGMFLKTTLEEIINRNQSHERWFTEPFELNGAQVYLSAQWNATGDYQLTLDDFVKMIQCCYGKEYVYKLGENNEHQLWLISEKNSESYKISDAKFDPNLLFAMRTKPFLLLAGISGTGKSRIVKQMAFESCPEIEQLRSDKTSPGNYQLIEVKPNWHDSTEVLGYVSAISDRYITTPFVKFLVKAMCYPDVPFFVCMDEMNLAPVEQYFAEFLSVLESRKFVEDKITSEPLVKADIFKKYETQLRADLRKKSDEDSSTYNSTSTNDEQAEYGKFEEVYELLKAEGLRIPSNLIVVGTVNMDETTHQFSRKVIDRAMTIEMNIADSEDPFSKFFTDSKDLEYSPAPLAKELFLPSVVQAKEALDKLNKKHPNDVECLKENIPTLLHSLNQALNGTPFKIAYRVQNELVLYFYELRKEYADTTAEELLTHAMDAILMLKVLPRIEGDEALLKKPLKKLAEFTAVYEQAHAKVKEMQERLDLGQFTSFWP